MLNTSFSLTEHIIINPILRMRAPLRNQHASASSIICHHANAECSARVVALFTSVFAATDTLTHLLTGVYKGGYLGLRKCGLVKAASWNTSEVLEHFKRAAFFAGVAAVGSIAAIIWPDVVKYFKRSTITEIDLNDVPEAINRLASDLETYPKVINGTEYSELDLLKSFWDHSDLSTKNWFVQFFNYPRANNGTLFSIAFRVRRIFAEHVYRCAKPASPLPKICWLNEYSINIHFFPYPIKKTSKAFYFHATSKTALETILKSQKVEVRHEKAFRGAFVSTKPEFAFGDCVLAFDRNIERLSRLNHGFNNGDEYWAGFSEDIPVTVNTLAYVILNSTDSNQRSVLEQTCKTLTGRQIDVFLYSEVEDTINTIKNLNMGIPIEWPGEDSMSGQILQILTSPPSVSQNSQPRIPQPPAGSPSPSLIHLIHLLVQKFWSTLFSQSQPTNHHQMTRERMAVLN